MGLKAKAFILVATAGSCFMFGYIDGGMQLPEQQPESPSLFAEAMRPVHQDLFVTTRELDALERRVAEASGWSVGKSLTLGKLREHRQSLQGLRHASLSVLSQSATGLASKNCAGARQLLRLLQKATALSFDQLDHVLPSASGWTRELANWSASNSSEMVVTFKERPFGMHVMSGTAYVTRVFTGFPAHHFGVHAGCEILEVAGERVSPGLLIEALQQAPLPLPVKLNCSQHADDSKHHHCVVSADPRRYRVAVSADVFGMNIQAYRLPRVVEVLPGFPAEACGVRKGFVLTEVNDEAVDVSTWFEAVQKAQKPYTLTFDTQIPLHAGNPFMNYTDVEDWNLFDDNRTDDGYDDDGEGLEELEAQEESENSIPPPFREGHASFECEVTELPFGMLLRAPRHSWPVVDSVANGSQASLKGVLRGDVLVRIAGLPVDSSSWFAAFSESQPPFGLTFRRPLTDNATAAAAESGSTTFAVLP